MNIFFHAYNLKPSIPSPIQSSAEDFHNVIILSNVKSLFKDASLKVVDLYEFKNGGYILKILLLKSKIYSRIIFKISMFFYICL